MNDTVERSDFEFALSLLKDGKFVKRQCVKNNTVIVKHKERLYQMSLETGVRYPYVPTSADLMAYDWIEIIPKSKDAMMNPIQSERELIMQAINSASEWYQDGKTPEAGCLDELVEDLYMNLFGYRDTRPKQALDRPAANPLVDCLKELRFGRMRDDQLFLEECILKLESNTH